MRLTRDPKLITATRRPVLNLALVINHRYRTPEGGVKDDPPTYIEAEAYDGAAETILRFSKKGHRIYLEGRLQLETWGSAAQGGVRSTLKLIVEKFNFVEQIEKSAAPQPAAEPEGDVPY